MVRDVSGFSPSSTAPLAADAPDVTRPPTLAGLLCALTTVVAPHAAHLPWWVTLFALVTGVWRSILGRYRKPLPRRLTRVLLVSVTLAAVYANFHTLTGRDAGVALLILMVGLKLLEVGARRDLYVAVFLGYFLAITNFLYSQTILMAIYMAVPVLLLTASLVSANDLRQVLGVAGAVRLAARMLLYAIPLACTQFLFFPRVTGPLWGLPTDAYRGLTGLSDELAPGQISRLSQSDAVAFRVEFTESTPSPAMLYWRGPVFWRTDGRRWTRSTPKGTPPPVDPSAPVIHYTVTIEPHEGRWLFPLELPVAAPRGTEITSDLQLLARNAVQQRSLYQLVSRLSHATGSLTPSERSLGLELPSGYNPRARQLGALWARTWVQPTAVVQEALAYFRRQSFVYTLESPRLGSNPVDEFLFDTRRGYCEHYATAFVVLMRAAGIPARVVTGYQGGTYNPLGGYLIVQERDAHAWSEVWFAGQGWVRVDPTAAVAPERIELGMERFQGVSARGSLPEMVFWQWAADNLRLGWDAVNNGWNHWILGYGPQLQRELFGSLGWPDVTWQGLTIALVLAMTLGLAVLVARFSPVRETPDPLGELYRQFCAKLARRGIPRSPNEGPLAYARRVGQTVPRHARMVQLIIRIYVALRYRCVQRPLWQRRLGRLVRAFRP